MTDGVTLPATSGTVDTELTARGHMQRVKLATGALDVDGGDVTTGNPLPVGIASSFFIVSSGNSSTAQLAASATFTGSIESVLNQPDASVMLISDQPGTLTLLQYIDSGGTKLAHSDTYSIAAGVPLSASIVLNGNYFNATFKNNGASTTTTFTLDIAYGSLDSVTNLGNKPVALAEYNGAALSPSNGLPVFTDGILDGKAYTGTASAIATLITFTADKLQGMQSISFGFSAVGTGGGVSVDVSYDGGVTWLTEKFYRTDLASQGDIISVSSITAAMKFSVPVFGNGLRIKLYQWTSGSFTCIAAAKRTPILPVSSVIIGGSVTVSSSSTSSPTSTTDQASAAITTTTTSAAITPSGGGEYQVVIPITAVSGTSPTMDVVIQESEDGGTNWYDIYHFPRATGTGVLYSPVLLFKGTRIRYVATLAGTTPSFTRSIVRLMSNVPPKNFIRRIFDRAISLTTLNATTTTAAGFPLNVQDCQNLQLIISLGAATTPPILQLQVSEDNGVTWTNIGTTLTGVANSTVSQTVSNVCTELVRAIVTTAGATVTPNFISIKGW
jgi:hypothetical protein